MPPLDSIFSVTLAGLALSATPGPSMLYVLSRSIGQGRAAGVASALGLCLGGILLACATAFGLATLFASFPWMVTALKFLGSAYLIWLGVRLIAAERQQSGPAIPMQKAAGQCLAATVWQGILIELLNPKTVLFFALFLPPFVAADAEMPTAGNYALQLLILGSLVPLTAIPSDLFVACLGGATTHLLDDRKATRGLLAWTGGLILIGIAVSLQVPHR